MFKNGGIIIFSEITKKQFNNSIIKFIKKFHRLPYMLGDEIEFEIDIDGEKKTIERRANPYIKRFYETSEKMADELLEQRIFKYQFIADILGTSQTIVRNAITKETANPRDEVRRGLDIFFNNDFYEKELGKYANRCAKCTRRCKQHYWVEVAYCSKYKEKINK